MNSYNSFLSVQDQAQLLIDKELICNDKARLERYLYSIGYYRLSIYWFPYFSSQEDKFVPDTTFDKILGIYIFDRKLRLLVMEAFERIEVALRVQWSNALTLEYNDIHAYRKQDLFKNTSLHRKCLCELDDEFKKGSRIQHYKDNNSSSLFSPTCVAVEMMSFGTLSRWLENTKDTAPKKIVMEKFGMPNIKVLERVFHALTPVRNVCAHHSRLWNHRFVFPLPTIHKIKASFKCKESNSNQLDNHLYNYLVVIDALLREISPNTSWTNRLITLLNTVESTNHKAMGFPDDWREREPWKSNVA